jgi:hypothetical protein
MRQDPNGRSQYGQGGGRRGGGLGNLRWLILLGFLVYGGCYYFGNRVVDPYTGEKVLIDNSIGVEGKKRSACRRTRKSCSRNARSIRIRRSRNRCARSPSA